jgi:anti-sigma regulatory factor (Ser/Thr protein kinase)
MLSLVAPEDRDVAYRNADALVRLAACSTAPSRARRFVKSVLQLWDMSEWEENAMLCASELVTNSVIAGQNMYQQADSPSPEAIGVVILCAVIDGCRLRIEAWDASERQATIREAGPHDEHGRGLALVQATSDRWGSDLALFETRTRRLCKVTWCEWDLTATGPEPP